MDYSYLLLIVSLAHWLFAPLAQANARCEFMAEEQGLVSAEKRLADFTRKLFDHLGERPTHKAIPDLVEPLIKEVHNDLATLTEAEQKRLGGVTTEFVLHTGRDFLKGDWIMNVSLDDFRVHVYDVGLRHPLSPVLMRHELTHLLRFAADPKLHRERNKFVQHEHARAEEQAAFENQYDFIRRYISKEQIAAYKAAAQYRPKAEVQAWGLKNGLLTLSGGEYQLAADAFRAFFSKASGEEKVLATQLLASVRLGDAFIDNLDTSAGKRAFRDLIIKAAIDQYLVADIDAALDLRRDDYVQKNLRPYGLDAPATKPLSTGPLASARNALRAFTSYLLGSTL